MIKTWQERFDANEHPHYTEYDAMNAEIDELRAALQAQPVQHLSESDTARVEWCISVLEDVKTLGRDNTLGDSWPHVVMVIGALKRVLQPNLPDHAQPVQPAADPRTLMDVTIDDDEALKFLRDMVAPPLLDGELTPVRILLGDGHSGYGLYVAAAEYQDQGAWLLASVAAPVAQPVQEPVLTEAQIAAHGFKASQMMARDQTRFDAGCEVMRYLKQEHAPYYYLHRMSTVLHGNTEGTEASRAPEDALKAEAQSTQPVQEPVQYGIYFPELKATRWGFSSRVDAEKIAEVSIRPNEIVPLCRCPVQPVQSPPLTDEQIDILQEKYDCFGHVDAPRLHDFARAIEAALRTGGAG
jgi:hypothetical protein